MKLYSTDALPPGIENRKVFDLIVHTGTVVLGRRETGLIDERSQAVGRKFVAMASEKINAAIGVQIATNVVLYNIGGGGVLYLTYCGNRAVIEEA